MFCYRVNSEQHSSWIWKTATQSPRQRMGRYQQRNSWMPTSFNSAKSSLYRSRRKQTPPLPRSMTDIALEGRWTQRATGDNFLLFDDNQPTRCIIAFATTENLRDLTNADIVFCDGTFYTCSTRCTAYTFPSTTSWHQIFMPSSLERVKPPTPDSSLSSKTILLTWA